MSEVDPAEFRAALGTFLTGVVIATTIDAEGAPRGITANAFSSISLDPPLVMICVDHRASTHDAFAGSQGFVVNIMADSDLELANTFAKRGADKFAGVDYHLGVGGAPVLASCASWIDCTTESVIPAGDHSIILGRVRKVQVGAAAPLGFLRGRFVGTAPALSTDHAAKGAEYRVGFVLETADGDVLLKPAGDGRYDLPHARVPHEDVERVGVSRLAADAIGSPVQVDELYSIYSDRVTNLPALVYRGLLVDAAGATADGKFEIVPIDSLDPQTLRSEGDRSVIERYLRERPELAFSIYASVGWAEPSA